MKKTSIILSILVMFSLVACNMGGYKKTKSGILYKIISNGSQPAVKRGNVLKFNFIQKVNFTLRGKDSVLTSSYEKSPVYLPVDSIGAAYDPREVFINLHKGDSAVIVMMADTLFKKQGGLPPFLSRKDKLTIYMRVVDVFTSDSAAQADNMAESIKGQQRQTEEENKLKGPASDAIQKYLDSAKITATKAPLGTYVVVKEPGNGPQVDSGKFAAVKYTGKLFPSGKVFESNMDKEPYNVPVGKHAVIAGWDEGLKYFKKGGKGTLYVPFYLAYGMNAGPGGSPHENLIFDVEIVNVQDSLPKPPAPGVTPPATSRKKK